MVERCANIWAYVYIIWNQIMALPLSAYFEEFRVFSGLCRLERRGLK